MDKLESTRRELGAARAELDDVYTIAEERIYDCYGCTREEIITILEEQISALEQEVDELTRRKAPMSSVDEAFTSWKDYNQFRY